MCKKQPQQRGGRSVLLVVLALLAGTNNLSAQQRGPSDAEIEARAESRLPPRSKNAVKTIDLRPDPRNRIDFHALKLDILSDGRRTVRGGRIHLQRDVDEFIGFEIDPDAGTYRTFSAEEMYGDPATAQAKLEELRSRGMQNLRPIKCSCPQPCDGYWFQWVATLDLAFEELTATTASQAWSQHPATCKLIGSGYGTCWAANPSQFGTHWFNTYCRTFFSSGFWGLSTEQVGDYYNDDFLLDFRRTYVFQDSYVELDHFWGVYTSWSHTDYGEGSSIIFGYVYSYGRNNCENQW